MKWTQPTTCFLKLQLRLNDRLGKPGTVDFEYSLRIQVRGETGCREIEVKVESRMAELTGGKRKRGDDEPARLSQDTMKLESESSMAEYADENLKRGEDEPASSNQRKLKSGEILALAHPHTSVRLNQDMIKLEAESKCGVLLSFMGADDCFGFVSSLYRRLLADRIRVYRYDGICIAVDELSLYSSTIYIPIFSRTYACCSLCLEALTLMVEHTSRSGQKKEILPVFYNVERSDVKLETESLYKDAMDAYRRSLVDEKVEQWKKALVEAGKVKGWERRSFISEGELITMIVEDISPMLKIEHNYAPGELSTSAEPLKTSIKSEDLLTAAGPLKASIEHNYVTEDLFTSAKPVKTKKHEDLFTSAQPLKTDINQYKPARLDHIKKENSKVEQARRNQDKINLKAGSSTANNAGTKQRKVKVEQVRLNQDMIKSEAESNYDVFLSFNGQDSLGLADILYGHLEAHGIHVFRHDGNVPTPPELQPMVYSSKIYVPIFSIGYAYSNCCLDVLALMVEHTSSSGGKKEILPVFYHVEQLDEKLETTSIYRDALDRQRQNWGPEKVERWKKALVEAGKVKRWKLSIYESPRELITSMNEGISFKLKRKYDYVLEDLLAGAGLMSFCSPSEFQDSQKSKIMRLLELEVNDVRIVEIHGRDGIGKTALAKIVYDQISLHFDACSFLVDIEETMQQPGGLQNLQTKLIFDILKRENEVASAFKGIQFFKRILRNMKVLIVLDDMGRASLLEDLAELNWFGKGSRIIVTSGQKRIFQRFDRTYNVIPMDYNLAFNFFWRYATGQSDELQSYLDIAKKIVKVAKGLPLLLKVFGSFLHNKGKEEWIKFLDLIQPCQEDCQQILSIIYEALDQKQKQMYLKIACLPPDVDCRIASYMWYHYDRPNDVIEDLRSMSLIETEENKIGMHSMLRCLARNIIRKAFHDPGTGVGLDIPARAQNRSKRKKGKDHLNTKVAGYEILPNTTFLSLGRVFEGQFADALSNVQWLLWQGCPRNPISIHLEKNKNLVLLDLSWGEVTESWGGWKRIKMEHLKVLNLTGCANLLVTPSFSCYPNLEKLILERCSRLVHLDSSINDLKLLVSLSLRFCSELSVLPEEMDGMIALRELLIDGTSIRKLPESIGKLFQLQILSATNCRSLVLVPGSVCGLKALSELALDEAKILELPESIGDLGELRRLSLRDCRGLRMIPESIGRLAGSLVELDVSGTSISKLPDSTKNLRSVKVLKMDSCFIKEIPCVIGQLIYLEKVHASWCRSLEGAIPSDIWKLHRLRELRLRGTCISSLPSEIQFMSSLETLDLLHCNMLKELPPLPSTLIDLQVDTGLMPEL